MSIKVSVVPFTAHQQNCCMLRCEETGRRRYSAHG